MNNNYKISIFTDKNRISEIIELFKTGLSDTTETFWTWRLFSKNNKNGGVMYVARDHLGKIAGMCIVFPILYGDKLSNRKCLLWGDLVVSVDHRGKGIMSLLYNHIINAYTQMHYDFIAGFPNQNSRPALIKYGFTSFPSFSYKTSKHLLFSNSAPSDFTLEGVSYKFSANCPIDLTFANRSGRIYRTYEFMHWKFDLNPDTEYRWLTLQKDGKYIGYFVYTFNKGRFNTALNVYDWEYTYSSHAPFCHAIKALRKSANYVEIWGKYSKETEDLLKTAGAVNIGDAAKLMLKSLSDIGWDEDITLTRIDTDY